MKEQSQSAVNSLSRTTFSVRVCTALHPCTPPAAALWLVSAETGEAFGSLCFWFHVLKRCHLVLTVRSAGRAGLGTFASQTGKLVSCFLMFLS